MFQEFVTLRNGYDRHKVAEEIRFRRFTLNDIKALEIAHYGTEYWFEARDGTARNCRKASALKTWKRNTERFECTFKYGMYESDRMSTSDMLQRLLVRIE